MNRGISTVVDVSLAIVLVGTSVAVLSGVPAAHSQLMTTPNTGGAAVAGSTLTVEYERPDGEMATVTGTVAGLLRDAAIARSRGPAGEYAGAVTSAIGGRLDRTGAPAQLVAGCGGIDPVVAGPHPPTGVAVTATVYRWNGTASGADRQCRPVVVVRRWSP